jgi:ion channel POLLUX/CASTOR
MPKHTLREKLQYHFENTMSGGPMAVIRWLAIVSIASVLVLGGIIVAAGIARSSEPDAEPLTFVEGVWASLMATLDPGTMGGDENWDFRIVRFIATLTGIFLISILIGSIASGIDQKIEDLKRGRSRVIHGNHTLILGWSEKIFTIVKEVVEANANQKRPVIVILSDKDKVEAEEEIRSRVPDVKNTKIVVRSGSTLESTAAEMVNIHEARSIIVLSPEGVENPDTYVIKTVLGITNGKNRKVDPYHIVAEIRDERNLDAAELVGNGEAVYVLSEDLISRVVAQTCRQSGLSVVYSDLLEFEGDEIYFADIPESLVGKTYRESLFTYQTSCVIGVYTADAEVLINPAMDRVFVAGEQVIAISEDDDTVVPNGRGITSDAAAFASAGDHGLKQETTLILGWNSIAPRIIRELDNYVKGDSGVLVVANDSQVDAEVTKLAAEIKNQKLAFIEGDTTERKTLHDINTRSFNHIIVLSNRDIDIQESDAKTLITLLHLRSIADSEGVDYSIVTEMLDMRNRELGVVAKADDFVVSDNLISLMLSQLSENRELKKVYDVLFEAEGSEIYLKPASRYAPIGQPLDFYAVLASAAAMNETAVGYRVAAKERDSENHYGIRLNPDKSEKFTFAENDCVIVLSED